MYQHQNPVIFLYLTYPLSPSTPQGDCKDDDALCAAAGADLTQQPFDIADWLVKWSQTIPAGAPVVIGNYTYLDGDMHVKVRNTHVYILSCNNCNTLLIVTIDVLFVCLFAFWCFVFLLVAWFVLCAKLSLCADVLIQSLRKARPSCAVAFLCTPTGNISPTTSTMITCLPPSTFSHFSTPNISYTSHSLIYYPPPP